MNLGHVFSRPSISTKCVHLNCSYNLKLLVFTYYKSNLLTVYFENSFSQSKQQISSGFCLLNRYSLVFDALTRLTYFTFVSTLSCVERALFWKTKIIKSIAFTNFDMYFVFLHFSMKWSIHSLLQIMSRQIPLTNFRFKK